MKKPDTDQERLLTLSEAAERLGVHPATVRRWADKGEIEVRVTAGGHRRFPESAVLRLAGGGTGSAGAPVVSQSAGGATASVADRLAAGDRAEAARSLESQAISVTRSEMRHHVDERWMSQLSDEEREEKRMLGRRLVGLMMQYLAREDGDGQEILAEARAIGRLYARTSMQSGMELADALKATMFFRDNLVESAILMPESARTGPDAGRPGPDASTRVYRRINEFLNAVQLAVAEVYDAHRATTP